MIILGVDPGSRFCGYGLLEIQNNRIEAAGCDVIRINEKLDLPQRLTVIYKGISEVIKEYKPDIAAVETIFYGKNIRSAFTLGHARGVILLALADSDIKIHEYSPREIKKSVVGNGNASKEQVQYMIGKILNFTEKKLTEDSADALAVALCEFNKLKFTAKTE